MKMIGKAHIQWDHHFERLRELPLLLPFVSKRYYEIPVSRVDELIPVHNSSVWIGIPRFQQSLLL